MSEQVRRTIDLPIEPEQRQFQAIYDALREYVEAGHVRSAEYADDMPAGDDPATKYLLSLPADQAVHLFGVPPEIRAKKPGYFQLDLITPHRFSPADPFAVTVSFSYRYDFDRTADYILTGDVLPDGSLHWSGRYSQDETHDWSVDSEERELTHEDLDRLAIITTAATQLKR